jgi:hypothetical protein
MTLFSINITFTFIDGFFSSLFSSDLKVPLWLNRKIFPKLTWVSLTKSKNSLLPLSCNFGYTKDDGKQRLDPEYLQENSCTMFECVQNENDIYELCTKGKELQKCEIPCYTLSDGTNRKNGYCKK